MARRRGKQTADNPDTLSSASQDSRAAAWAKARKRDQELVERIKADEARMAKAKLSGTTHLTLPEGLAKKIDFSGMMEGFGSRAELSPPTGAQAAFMAKHFGMTPDFAGLPTTSGRPEEPMRAKRPYVTMLENVIAGAYRLAQSTNEGMTFVQGMTGDPGPVFTYTDDSGTQETPLRSVRLTPADLRKDDKVLAKIVDAKIQDRIRSDISDMLGIPAISSMSQRLEAMLRRVAKEHGLFPAIYVGEQAVNVEGDGWVLPFAVAWAYEDELEDDDPEDEDLYLSAASLKWGEPTISFTTLGEVPE